LSFDWIPQKPECLIMLLGKKGKRASYHAVGKTHINFVQASERKYLMKMCKGFLFLQ